MSYVPPALRRKQEALAKGEKLSDDASTPETSDPGPMSTLPTVTDIQNHFWPPKKGVSQTNPQASANGEKDASQSLQKDISQSIEGGANLEDRASKTNSEDGASGGIKSTLPHSHSTLNGTQAEPDKLKYVLLFHQAHPRWQTDQIIYVKSELQLLPQPEPPAEPSTDNNVNNSPPSPVDSPTLPAQIMIFEQDSERNQSRARFTFLGYFDLIKMQILEPNTPALIRMLEQKWTRIGKWGQSHQIQRDADSWKKSLGYRWAVLKFAKNEEATKALEPPRIEVTMNDMGVRKEDLWSGSRKGVNEMLRDIRVKDSKDEKEKAALTGWHAVAALEDQ